MERPGADLLRQSFGLDDTSALAAATAATGLAMRQLNAAWAKTEASSREPVKNSEPLAAAMRRSSAKLAELLAERAKQDAGNGSPGAANLAFQAARVAKRAAQVHWSLYDAGETVHVVPALEPTALEADRHRSEIHPWISLQALLQGSRKLLSGYPQGQVAGIRASWVEAQVAYRDRDHADRAAKFSAAMQRFAAEIRETPTLIEPSRRELVIQERDDGLLAKTAYPAAIVTDVEFYYNRIDPFFWSGCVSLGAVGVLALSFLIAARKPLFWIGLGTLVLAITLVAGGFLTRMYLTHWAPVTSMYETIVWVAMCVAVLTVWVTFLPLLSSLGRAAWNLTALPGTARRDRSASVLPASPCRAGGLPRRVGVGPPLRHLSLGTLYSWPVSARQLEFGVSPGLILAAGRHWFQTSDGQFAAGLALLDLRNRDVDVVCTASDPCGDCGHPADHRLGPAVRWRRSGREGLPLARRGLGRGGGYDVGRLGGLQRAVPQGDSGPHARAAEQLLARHPRADHRHLLRRGPGGLGDCQRHAGLLLVRTIPSRAGTGPCDPVGQGNV